MTAPVLRHPTYEERVRSFNWSIAEAELGYIPRGPINIGWHCSDRICSLGLGNRAALVWENFRGDRQTLTFDDVRVLSNTFARYLQFLNVGVGERVSLLMDWIPELYVGLLGVLKMGAIAQPLGPTSAEEALSTPLHHAATATIITQRKHVMKIRAIRNRLPRLRHVIVVDAEGFALQKGEIALALRNEPRVEEFDIYPSTADTPSILHYTPAAPGQPMKGALHVHYSIVAQYLTTKWALDLQPADVHWCTAEPGSAAATSYGIIGPWSNGVTQVALDAMVDAERWYRFIQDHDVSIWFADPRSLRTLMRDGTEGVHDFDLSSLRHLVSCNEALVPELLLWSQQAFGLAFHGTFCQPETGCMVLANLPGMPIKAGSFGRPFPGVTATVVSADSFEPIESGRPGVVALASPWPSMFRSYWNDPAGYQAKFKKGWYVTGEPALVDADGYFWPADRSCSSCGK